MFKSKSSYSFLAKAS